MDIAALRRAAITVAQSPGLGIVAAGTVPIAGPDTLTITPDPRYGHMGGEYRMLVREQPICRTQVRVDVNDRDLAAAAARRVAPWLSALLALSASSPFRLGTDTGYASYRTLIWRCWPATGAPGGFASAADYDQAVADLIRSGVITDPGMTCFDVRPSAHLPTVELRICDACPCLQDVVLIAGCSAPWSSGRRAPRSRARRRCRSVRLPEDAVVVIQDPHLDRDTLTYSIKVLEGTVPAATGPCALFIDPLGRPLLPVSVAGMHRRARRRGR